MIISASFLSVEEKSKETIFNLINAGANYIHVDVADGKFVSTKTESFDELKKILPLSTPYDVHLMVEDVAPYIEEYASIHPEYITIHVEIDGVLKGIDLIKDKKIKVGLAMNPNTSIHRILPYLPLIDLVLVMGVEPGKGGQTFIPSTLNKVNELKRIKQIYNYHYLIEVDGGINDTIAPNCKSADILVSGSFITKSYDYKGQIEKIKKTLE